MTIRIYVHHPSRGANISIKRVRSGVRGHMGSGVTETNCSEEDRMCNDPVGGCISGTCANNKHFDPYTRTSKTLIIIPTTHTLQIAAMHTLPNSRSQMKENIMLNRLPRNEQEHNNTACVKCAMI